MKIVKIWGPCLELPCDVGEWRMQAAQLARFKQGAQESILILTSLKWSFIGHSPYTSTCFRCFIPFLPVKWGHIIHSRQISALEDISSGVNCPRPWTSHFTSLLPVSSSVKWLLCGLKEILSFVRAIVPVCAGHSSRCFMCGPCHSLESCDVVVIIIPILQKRNSSERWGDLSKVTRLST